jgi:primosomal protein N'
MKDDKEGWWNVSESEKWCCPECKEWSSYTEWDEATAPCEDCGEHEARVCPNCGEVYDHVYGSDRIAEAMHNYAKKEM